MGRSHKSPVCIVFIIKNVFDFANSRISDNSIKCSVSFNSQLIQIKKVIPLCHIAMSVRRSPNISKTLQSSLTLRVSLPTTFHSCHSDPQRQLLRPSNEIIRPSLYQFHLHHLKVSCWER